MNEISLSECVGSTGVFTDGDWVETKDQDPNGEVRLIQLADIGVGTFLDKSARFLTLETARRLRCTFLEPGDLLIARMPDPIGRACIFPGLSQPCATVVDVCVLRPDARILNANFAKWMINSPQFLKKIEGFVSGSTRQRISRGNLAPLSIPLPPLEEQKRIAAILDQTDELRRKRQRALDRLNQLGQAFFIEMFGDVSQLPRTHSFDEVATIQQSLVDPKLPQYQSALHVGPEHLASGAGIVNWEAVRTAQEDSVISGKNRFERGDILYSKIRPYLNKVALADRSGICSADMYVIQPIEQKSTAHFLKALLMGNDFLAYAETCSNRANIPKLNRKQVEGYRFHCPPIEAQREFADRLNELEVIVSSYAKAAAASSTLFASLQHRAFRGELTASTLKEVAA